MIEVITDKLVERAIRQLSADPVLAPLFDAHPRCNLRPHKDYFRELVESIVGQQLSVKAAASINHRFADMFEAPFPTAEDILNQPVEYLREAGLSGAKVKYIRDLAEHVLDDKLEFENFDSLPNDQIVSELTAVKGIGEWTAHMFLMFCMARPDILPTGDLGIRNGVMKLYGLDHLPSPDEITQIADEHNWRPYESIASWYVWKSLDNAPKD